MSKWSKRKSYKPNDQQPSLFFDNNFSFYALLLMTFHLKNHHSLLCLITFYQKVLLILSSSSLLNFLNLVPYPIRQLVFRSRVVAFYQYLVLKFQLKNSILHSLERSSSLTFQPEGFDRLVHLIYRHQCLEVIFPSHHLMIWLGLWLVEQSPCPCQELVDLFLLQTLPLLFHALVDLKIYSFDSLIFDD